MSESPKFDTQILKVAWGKVTDGASSVIKDPSSVISFSKEVASFGSTAAKFLGIVENANDLRKLWRDPEEKKKHGLFGKIGLSIVYAANITASSIAAAVVLGASVVAAPIAAAIMSGATLVKNIADYTKENNYLKKLQNEEHVLAEELAKANISFEANTAFYHDLENAKTEIVELNSQSRELQEEINNLQSLPEKEATPEQDELVSQYLREEADEIQTALSEKAQANRILAKNYHGKHQSESTAESLVRIQDRQQIFTLAKKDLLKEIETAGPNIKSLLEQKLKIVESKLAKYEILKVHHEKVQALESQLEEVKALQANLDTKYNNEPYKNGTVDKKVEAEYLILRAAELENIIANKKDPERRANKAQKYQQEAQQFSKIGDLKTALIDNLNRQKEKLDGKSQKANQVLSNKERFVSLFTKDPKQAMVGDAKSVYEKSLALLDKKSEIKITKLDRYKKAKGIGFAAAGLAVATCICLPPLWPVAGVLGIVGAAVGAVWGISSLWDKYQKSKAEKEIIKAKGPEAIKLLEQLDTHMSNKAEKELAKKAALTQELGNKLDHAHSHSPLPIVATHDVHLINKSKGVLNHHQESRKRANAAITAQSNVSVTVAAPAESPSKSRSNR